MMSKYNLLAIALVVIVTVIAADVKVNDYMDNSDLRSTIINPSATDVDPGLVDFDTSEFREDQKEVKQSKIGFNLVTQSGFKNVTLQQLPFNGIVFEKIDMRDFMSVPVFKQNLLADNRDVSAGFYEFHADNSLLANEIYLLIKEKASSSIDTGINETNDFGEKSFYLNYKDKKDDAFLVVKISQSVYALQYEKNLHSFMKILLQNLSS
jgi:hypothetical protein